MKYLKRLGIDFNDFDDMETSSKYSQDVLNFIDFLSSRYLLDIYVKNFKECKGSHDPYYCNRKSFEKYDGDVFWFLSNEKFQSNRYVSYAFDWVETKEGFDFWNDIDDEWKEYYI